MCFLHYDFDLEMCLGLQYSGVHLSIVLHVHFKSCPNMVCCVHFHWVMWLAPNIMHFFDILTYSLQVHWSLQLRATKACTFIMTSQLPKVQLYRQQTTGENIVFGDFLRTSIFLFSFFLWSSFSSSSLLRVLFSGSLLNSAHDSNFEW